MDASRNDHRSAAEKPFDNTNGSTATEVKGLATQSIIQSVLKAEIRKLQDEVDSHRKKNQALEEELASLKEVLDKSSMQETINKNDDQSKSGRELSSSSRFKHDFDIKSILGVGGFGVVFEATNFYDGWKYAVKKISVESSELEKAFQEVRAMAQIDHPGIVGYNSVWVEEPELKMQHIEDLKILKECTETSAKVAGEYEKHVHLYWRKPIRIYIQMQLCSHTLSAWLAINRDPMSRLAYRMKSWFKQIVSAVNYIHKKNLIHRDLKPGNILFADDDHLKLCDLGLATAREVDGRVTTVFTRTSAGSDLYMSPEVRSSEKYGSKTDVFTLGLILVELFTVMTPAERTKIFDNYRKAEQIGVVEDLETDAFVRMLTNVDSEKRPTCLEMLDHEFLCSI